MLYNRPETIFYKAAVKLEKYVDSLLPSIVMKLSEMTLDSRGLWICPASQDYLNNLSGQ